MDDDEFLLVMAHCEDRSPSFPDYTYVMNIADRRRLYDIGIKTIHEQPSWAMIEPSKGDYNFDYLDTIINRNREARLKSLVQIHGWRIPDWIPNEWRARQKNGTYELETLSMWNEEAQQYSDKYYKMLDDRYMADPDVMFFFGEWQGGEGVYPSTWCLYDDAAIQDYKRVYSTSAEPIPDNPDTLDWFGKKCIQHFVRKSTIIQPKFQEVWNMQQYLMDTWTKAFGNFVELDIMKEYRRLWPEGSIVSCQCTYYDSSHKQDNVEFVDLISAVSGCETLVEAMHCRGLPETTPKAIAHGFRGQVVFPAYEDNANGLLQWHINNMAVSNQLWRKNYELHGR